MSGQGVSEYFNRLDVYKNLNIFYEEEDYQTWDLCTDRIDYQRNTDGSYKYYDEIQKAGV